MNKCGCGCKAVLSLSTKPNSVIQIKDRDEPFLNMNTKDKGVDATINGVTTLTLKATDGLELIQEGDVATISGSQLQGDISSVSGRLEEETTNRQNADNALSQRITENTNRFNNYRTSSDQDVIDNNLQQQINAVSGDLSNYRTAADQDIIDQNQNNAINQKQSQLTQTQLSAVNSGITQQKVSAYDTHVSNTTIHVTQQEKTTWNNKQNAISDLNEIRAGASDGATALQPSDVVDNTSTTSAQLPLSANMGKSLQDQIDNLKARGRFFALWDCATGMAETNPPQSPYNYQTGDYFIVGNVASGSGTNYRPSGSSYTTGVPSTAVETEAVDIDDVYYYDGTSWHLQVNTQKTVSFSNLAGSPYDNTNLGAALNDKEDLSNKVTSLSAQSTDDEYPSAKCMWDLIGDVESLINAL